MFADIFLSHVVRDTAGDHMHSVRADADETVERSEPGRTAAVGRESEGQETRDPNGRRRGRHIRFLLVSDTSESPCIRSNLVIPTDRLQYCRRVLVRARRFFFKTFYSPRLY